MCASAVCRYNFYIGQFVPDRDFLDLVGEVTVSGRNFSNSEFPRSAPPRAGPLDALMRYAQISRATHITPRVNLDEGKVVDCVFTRDRSRVRQGEGLSIISGCCLGNLWTVFQCRVIRK